MRRALLALVLIAACKPGGTSMGTDAGGGDDADDDDGPDAGVVDVDTEACPEPLKQHFLGEYQVGIAPAEWAALEDEFLNWEEREEQGLDPHPYHPVTLRFGGGAEVPNVLIRLKGNTSWRQTVELDPMPKMQFVLAFNEIDPDGRFGGMRKVELDMPRTDESFLRQRLGLFALRAMGVPAQCANSARLVINGEYYGLYTAIERLDKEFLQRQYGDADEGNLWKGGFTIETNEDTFDYDRLNLFWDAQTIADLEPIADLEASVRAWAGEAMLIQGDGYYWGRPNFYLYDHPDRGFVWLPHDLDSAVDYRPANASPLTPVEQPDPLMRQHWNLVQNDPTWSGRYIDALEELMGLYPAAEMQARVDAWSEQIEAAADADPRKPFTGVDHRRAVTALHDYPPQRAEFMTGWVACRRSGATAGCP